MGQYMPFLVYLRSFQEFLQNNSRRHQVSNWLFGVHADHLTIPQASMEILSYIPRLKIIDIFTEFQMLMAFLKLL